MPYNNDEQKYQENREDVMFAVTNRINMFPDGKYHWMSQADLLGNASKLKFLMLCSGITCFVFAIIICMGSGLTGLGLWECIKFVVVFTGICLLVTLLIYLVGAFAIGRKYQIVYEMDQNGIYMSRKLTKGQDLRWCASGYLMGMIANPVNSMDYFNLMSNHSKNLRMESVKSVLWESNRQSVKLGGDFGYYRIYIDERDRVRFVSHLKRCCRNLKKCR